MSAHGHHYDSVEDPGQFAAPKLKLIGMVLAVLGFVVGIVSALLSADSVERLFSSLLQAMLIPTYIGIAATFFISVNLVTNSVWFIPVRRLMEGLSIGIWLTLPTFLVIGIFGSSYLYDWINITDGAAHANLFHVHGGSKESVMNLPRFLITNLIFIVGWILFRQKLVSLSIQQDAGTNVTSSHKKWGMAFLIFFAPTFTFFIWDCVLSLHANWFSTMWGVYGFASAMQTFLCVLILFVLWMRTTRMKQHIGDHLVHDLGTWMVGWSCFVAYIAFDQFMLIYYANLDEETFWYVMRTQNGYGLQAVITIILRWPLVFLGLMSQSMRRRPAALIPICSIVILANWADWSWLIQPAFAINEYRCPFALPELFMGLGMSGAFLLLVASFWKKHGLIPKGDPKLLESMNAGHLH